MRTTVLAVMVASLLAAAVVAVSAMVHGAGKFEWNVFYPWVVGPYIVLFLVFWLPRSQSAARASAGCAAAVMVLLYSCWSYIGAMWFSASSTSALVFIFAPIYLLVGGLIVWGMAWFLIAKINPGRPA